MARSPKPKTDSPPSRVIWRATFTSRSFDFAAYGETKTGAKEALKLGLKHHTNQYNCAPDWWNEEDISVLEVKLGAAYRDEELIK